LLAICLLITGHWLLATNNWALVTGNWVLGGWGHIPPRWN